jgi:hypothetical protein
VAKQILKEAEGGSFEDRTAEVHHDSLNEITDRHEDDERLVLSNSIKLIVLIRLDSSGVDQISDLNQSGRMEHDGIVHGMYGVEIGSDVIDMEIF